jgi:hypothetical protein
MNPLFLASASKVVGTIPYRSPEDRDRERRARRTRERRRAGMRAVSAVRRWVRRLIFGI